MTQQPSTLAGSAVTAAEPAKPAQQPPPAPAAPTQAPAPAAAEAPAEAPAALAPVEAEEPEDSEAVKKDKKEKKKDKKDSRVRGVETMFRVTYNNHIALSQLADNKANMLISLNGAILSALIVILTPRLSSLSWPLVPVLVLVAGCTVSLAFAILGSRPRVGRTPVTFEQIRDNRGNALFFGQFTTMSLEQFQESMRLLTKDDQLVYDALTRQLYLMGESLLRKYRYLKIAYTLFFVAVALAAVSHGVLLIGFGNGT